MRLLDTRTMELKSFQCDIPLYAILSHVWEVDEVTFQDITNLKKAKRMRGYAKLAGACDTAKKDQLEYIWIDTCCINKDSSAELSEAINSMYMWYRNAIICYAYLSDVPSEGHHGVPRSPFSTSRWFTRGWTLQELIAPRRLIFYSRDWVDIGTKATLQDTISLVTRISPEVIVRETALEDVPIAVRMSWAAERNTTRVEDIAYSLMGIFDVNMPLLYGEGRKAFIRLQHEIIKKSTDHSIFAWRVPPGTIDTRPSAPRPFRGILAHSPEEYLYSVRVERILDSDGQPTHVSNGESLPYTITNRGLHIELPVHVGENKETFAFLNCRFSGKSEPIVLDLSRSWSTQSTITYMRSQPHRFVRTPPNASLAEISSIYIVDDDDSLDGDLQDSYSRINSFVFEVTVPPRHSSYIEAFGCREPTTDQRRRGLSVYQTSEFSDAALLFTDPGHKVEQFAVIGGCRSGEVWCKILSANEPENESDWKALIRFGYFGFGKGFPWTKKNRFLDRAYKDLTRDRTSRDLSVVQKPGRSTDTGEAAGWSVTASCLYLPGSAGLQKKIVIELKKSNSQRQKHPSPLMEVRAQITS